MSAPAQDDYSLQVRGEAPAGYPVQAQPDSFSEISFAPRWADRHSAFLKHWLANPSKADFKAPFGELVRAAAGGPVHEGVMLAGLDFINARRDCSDFILHAYLRLLYQFFDSGVVSADLLGRVRSTVLDFKYWPDEPGVDSLCTWTENHQILYNSAAYLAGQLYPEARFSNSGHSGKQKMETARPRILRWLDLRFRSGFSEWLSNVYYDEDLVPLLSLVDFCEDAEIVERARMVTDLILFDMACNLHRGVFGSTHGRSYEGSKKFAAQEGTTDTSKLLFGQGVFSGYDNMSAACFALSTNYRLPRVLYEIANDSTPLAHRQRMGLRLEEAEAWGLGFESAEDGMVWLSLEAYTHPRTIELTMRMFDEFNWWENGFFSMFKARRGLVTGLRRLGLLPSLARLLERDLTRNMRPEVNIKTLRTADYMLSSAQDWRPGYGGDQQHLWQASLGPDAVVFTTHPAQREGKTPNYWTGSGSLPRVGQVGSVALILYDIDTRPGLYLTHRLVFTHAWFPRSKFDEVVERDGWFFARRGAGYVALYSARATRPGEDPENEIIADGKQNVWICEVGRDEDCGTFHEFVASISAAPRRIRGLQVEYLSPYIGALSYGWKQPLLHRGAVVSQHDYPRYANPYCEAAFPAEQVRIERGPYWLDLNWAQANRRMDETGI